MYLIYVVIVALAAAFLILFLGKTGIREQLIMRLPKFFSELVECDFCLSFWTGAMLSLILSFVLNEFFLLSVPFFSAPLTRKML